MQQITLKALTEGRLDLEAMRKVTGDALAAVREAATPQDAHVTNAAKEAARGIECAKDFRADGALRDGTPVCVRAIRADDKVRLYAGFQRLSAGSIYRRFFWAKSTLTAHDLRYFTELDFVNHVGLAVTVGEGAKEAFIGVGRFIRDSAKVDEAEIAFIVADEYQHRGAATLLLTHLASLARRLRIQKFAAVVQADNHEILKLLQNSGLALEARVEATGITHLEVAPGRNRQP